MLLKSPTNSWMKLIHLKVLSIGFAGNLDLYMKGNVQYPLIYSCPEEQAYLRLVEKCEYKEETKIKTNFYEKFIRIWDTI